MNLFIDYNQTIYNYLSFHTGKDIIAWIANKMKTNADGTILNKSKIGY